MQLSKVFWERLRADAGMDAHIVESTDPSKLNWERLRAKTIIELQRAQGAQLSDFWREPLLWKTPQEATTRHPKWRPAPRSTSDNIGVPGRSTQKTTQYNFGPTPAWDGSETAP